jgi:hypothetical protein
MHNADIKKNEGRGCSSVVECLPSMQEAEFEPQYSKKKKEKKRKGPALFIDIRKLPKHICGKNLIKEDTIISFMEKSIVCICMQHVYIVFM